MSAQVDSAAHAAALDKRRRVRKAASCNSCRASKSRCDRGLPCSACVSRGHECVWAADAAPPLYTARDKNETESLRLEVQRLQGLIDVLVSGGGPQPPSPTGFTRLPSYHQADSSRSARSSDESHSPDGRSETSAGLPNHEDDLASIDLAHKLGELSLATFKVGADVGHDGHDPRPEPIIAEARSLLDEKELLPPSADNFVYGSSRAPKANYGLLPLGNRMTLPDIMARLPPKRMTIAPAATYWAAIAWYLHAIPFPVWQKHLDHVYQAQADGVEADPFSLANVFSIWAAGLGSMTVEEAAAQGIHSKAERVQEWLELASGSLACGHFLESPTVEAIRPLLLLAVYYVCLSPGDDGSSGVAYIALAVQCGLQLGLHRDPERKPGMFTAEQVDDRRRTFWLMYAVDQVISTTFARGYTLLHARDIDCKLPADVPDELMGQPEPEHPTDNMISHLIIRIKLAKLAERISDVAYGISPVTYSQVLALDKEVSQYEADIPSYYDFETFETVQDPLRAARILTIKLCVAQERLRLHRPYLARSLTDEQYAKSRWICLDCSRVILKILANPICATPWCGLLYKAICSCIVLGIDLIQLPNGPDAPSHRAYIDNALVTIEAHAKASTVCRRGLKLIRLLLSKDPHSQPRRPDEPQLFKRGRTNSGVPHQAASPQPYTVSESSLANWSGKTHAPASAVPSPADERHHKRPPAYASQSEEVLPSQATLSGPRPAQPLRSRAVTTANAGTGAQAGNWSASVAVGQATSDHQIDFGALLGYDETTNLSGRPQWSVPDTLSFFDPTQPPPQPRSVGASLEELDFGFASEPVGFGNIPPPPAPAPRPAQINRSSSQSSRGSAGQVQTQGDEWDSNPVALASMPSRIPALATQTSSSTYPITSASSTVPTSVYQTPNPATASSFVIPHVQGGTVNSSGQTPVLTTSPGSSELPSSFIEGIQAPTYGLNEDLFSSTGLLGSVGVTFDDLDFPFNTANITQTAV